MGFDIARGRTNNTDDLYFGIQFPASAGGAIQLFNPNAASPSPGGQPVSAECVYIGSL